MAQTTTGQEDPRSLAYALRNGKMNRRAWTITGMLVVLQIIAFADRAVLGLVAPSAIAELGMTTTQFGFVGSSFYFLYAVIAVVTGVLASKFSVKWILFVLGLTWALMQFPLLFGGGAAALLVTRIVLGGAEGPATPTSLAAVHSWFPASRRALPSNLVAIGSTLGPVIAAPMLGFVIAAWGWRWAFGVLGIFGLLWLVAWLVLGKDGPYAPNAGTASPAENDSTKSPDASESSAYSWFDKQKHVPIFKALLSGTFLITAFGVFTNFWTMGFLTTWLPQYLKVSASLTIEQVGIVTVFPWLFGAAVLLVLGIISRQLMKKEKTVRQAMGAPYSLTLVTGGLGFVFATQTSGALAIVLLTIAAGCSIIYPMGAAMVAYIVGMKQRPIVMSVLGATGSIGAIVSPVLVGWLMENAGYRAAPAGTVQTAEMVGRMVTGVNQSFLIAGLLLLVSGLLGLAFIRPDRTAKKLQGTVTL
ncbi:MFS transporter [Paenarthrobacter sp. NyZ202]|uniref:MFS transporter n=1 Tax=Paenarthrobacter sp. NyZ202 TaxID=3402689 RepID=UPI003CEC213B